MGPSFVWKPLKASPSSPPYQKGGNKLQRLNPTPPKKKVRFFGHGRTATVRSSSVLHPHSTFIFSAWLGSVLLLGVRPIKCKAAERARLRVWTLLFTRAFMGRGRWRLLMFVRFALFFFWYLFFVVGCGLLLFELLFNFVFLYDLLFLFLCSMLFFDAWMVEVILKVCLLVVLWIAQLLERSHGGANLVSSKMVKKC